MLGGGAWSGLLSGWFPAAHSLTPHWPHPLELEMLGARARDWVGTKVLPILGVPWDNRTARHRRLMFCGRTV